ncbi:MAG TPA: hypothetical protein VGA49_00970, partial [Patescibacteria group bacterium]
HYQIEESVLNYDLSFPPELFDNQEFEFAITVNNLSGDNDLKNIKIIPDWPDGFSLLESSVPFQTEIDILPPLEAIIIQAKGRVAGLDQTQKQFAFKGYLRHGQRDLFQRSRELTAPLSYPKFSLTARADQEGYSLGQIIDYQINFSNQEDYDLADVVFSLPLNSDIFNLNSVRSTGVLENGRLVWDLDEFQSVRASQSGSFRFSARLNSKINFSRYFREQSQIIITPEVSYLTADDGQAPRVKLRGAPAAVKINSDLGLTAFGRYYSAEGDQLGRGPLPPVAGRTTKYWVFLQVVNNLNDVNNLLVTAQLPDTVEFTGRTSVALGEDLSYNPASRTIQWPVGLIQSFRSGPDNGQGAAFEVAFTPTTDQVGAEPILLTNIAVSGADLFTGVFLQATTGGVTTNLFKDSLAAGKGRVE